MSPTGTRTKPRPLSLRAPEPSAGQRLGYVATGSWHAVERLIKDSIIRSLEVLNLSRREEVERLSSQVFALERDLRNARQRFKKQTSGLSIALAASRAEQQQLLDDQARLRPLAIVGSLVPGVAHDLSTPIGNSNLVVSGLDERVQDFAKLIESGELRRSDLNGFLAELSDGIGMLRASSERASELSNGLKHLAIDTASRRRREFCLDEVVTQTLSALQPTLRAAQIALETDIPGQLAMHSYPGAVGQVLTNLIQNTAVHAFHQSPTDALVRIEARRIGRNKVSLSITDNGCGMTRAVQAQLFTPYFTTALDRGGSGVGLYYAKQLVEGSLDGSIRVKSRVGHGTCFTIEMPVIVADSAPEFAAAAASPNHR